MLYFQSKYDKKKKIPDWTVLKKADQSDSKPTYFYIWPHSSYMYGIGCIKSSLISKNYLAQQQVYNAFVHQQLVTFRTCISVDLI